MMYKEIHISITTVCNMRCPDCVYGMRWKDQYHEPFGNIEKALKWFDGIPSICITVGEPTIHPRFHDIALMIRSRFPDAKLEFETNAFTYPVFQNSLPIFDMIYATLYGPDAWIGCPVNSSKIEMLRADYPKLTVREAKHDTIENNKGSNPCGRNLRAHWSHGLIYGCCAAPGNKNAIGIELDENWHDDLSSIQLPCSTCVFGQP